MSSICKFFTSSLIAVAVLTNCFAEENSKCAISFEKNGTAVLSNSMFSVSVSPYVGQDYGISKWFNKPSGFEMVDVLYGQTDYVKGHLLGERWEEAIKEGLPTGIPFSHNFLTAPISVKTDDDSRTNELVQVGEGDYRWTKKIIIRQDYTALEILYEMENLKGSPISTALRFHSAISPGARGKYQNKHEDIFMNTEKGILAVDQSLNADQYHERYKQDKFFLPVWAQEPKRSWVSGKLETPPLAGNWIVQVNRENGDGATIQIEKEKLVGFYNCPGITIEPVLRAVFLKQGEKWQSRCFIASFGGAKGEQIVDSNPLFVSCASPAVKDGKLAGRIIPLFKGKFQISGKEGKSIFEATADPMRKTELSVDVKDGNWKLTALDTQGRFIGSIDQNGSLELYTPKFEIRQVEKPAVNGKEVFSLDKDVKDIKAFLDGRDFTVYSAWGDSEEVKNLAAKIAHQLGVGLSYTNPKGKLLMIGSVNDPLIRDTSLMKHSLSADWPGKGKGAILFYDNLEFTECPAVIIGGSDSAGACVAEKTFLSEYIKDVKTPSGFVFWPADAEAQIYPYTRPGKTVADKISVKMAKGEYESAQAIITPYENISDIEITVSPLVNKDTGKEMPKAYAIPARNRIGPIQVRWVNYYPIDRKDGWAGYPDPLLVRPETYLKSDCSQALWLTFVTPDKMDAGVYTGSITCKAKQGSKVIPVEVKVWDFEIPKNEGLQGEAYTTLVNLPPAEMRELKAVHIQRWVQNLVEHGMRVIHIGVPGMIRYHFSKEGDLKNVGDWLFASDDGKIAMDASYLKWLIDESDKAGKPYELCYMLYLEQLLNNQVPDFSRSFPDRFKGMPERTGHFYANYYSQEMLTLVRKFLEKQNLMKRIIVKIGDEPRSLDWWYNRFVLAADKAGLPYYTCLNSIDWKDAENKINQLALWQPLYMHYNKDFFEKAKKAGAKVSWYNCGPPPKISVMTPASEIRGYMWHGAKADLDIIAWWGIQCWGSEGSGTGKDMWQNRYSHWNMVTYPEHPYKPPYTKTGQGWVDTAPIDSIRWELIREGMEDAWYVNLLRKEIAAAEKDGRAEAAKSAQADLDKIWNDVFPTLNDYKPPYETILNCREKIAEQILNLKKGVKQYSK